MARCNNHNEKDCAECEDKRNAQLEREAAAWRETLEAWEMHVTDHDAMDFLAEMSAIVDNFKESS